MAIKQPQWLLDRGFNLTKENESRVRAILWACNQVKNGKLTKEEAGKKIVEMNAAPSIDRYNQSTATAMRSYGFIQEAYCTTEIADKFLFGEITYSELILFQLIKKEYRYDDNSSIIKPLYVLLKICNYLLEKDPNLCWIDAYDYQKYLTEIKEYSQIDEYAERIYNDKINNVARTPLEYEINHFDIWVNSLASSGLFNQVDNEYAVTLNLDEKYLIDYLIQNYPKDEIFNCYKIPRGSGDEKIRMLANYGKANSSIYEIMPKLIFDDPKKIYSLATNDKKILELYLFEGKSFRDIDIDVLGDDYDTRGFFSKMVISGQFGINNENYHGEGNDKYKGCLKPFKNHPNFIKYNPNYSNENVKRIIDTIYGGKKMLKKRFKNPNRKYPFNRILYGAPGTGKTYSTAELAVAVLENATQRDLAEKYNSREELMKKYNEYIDDGRIIFTTFHQSYGYEEFIQGLRPNTNSDKLSFDTVDGVFKKIADKALNDDFNDYVIIIDEINRGNISKIFGELITLIENDKRWGEDNQMSVTLQSGDIFAVPNNLFIIGTMNTADKSISLIDAALRRRFEFMEQIPNAELIIDTKYPNSKTLKNVLNMINEYLAEELDSTDLLIGHSYFMNKSEDDLPEILNNNIIPLLYEYFYDDKNKVRNALNYVKEKTGAKFGISGDDYMGRIKATAE